MQECKKNWQDSALGSQPKIQNLNLWFSEQGENELESELHSKSLVKVPRLRGKIEVEIETNDTKLFWRESKYNKSI